MTCLPPEAAASGFAPPPLEFAVREERQPARYQRTVWLFFACVALVLMLVLFQPLGAAGAALVVSVSGVSVWWGLRAYRRKRFPPGVPALRIGADGIASPLIHGGPAALAWRDVAGVDVTRVGSQLSMRFLMRDATPAPGEQARRGRARGPRLVLDFFAPAAHAVIIDAVHASLARHLRPGERLPDNPVAAEQRFQAQLKALSPRTWVTWSLAGLNIAVFLAMAASTHELMSFPVATLLDWGANTAWEAQHGGWWRLGSSMFLHGGLIHLVFNMLALLTLGPLAERLFGPRAYLSVYLLAGLAGSALSLNFNAQQAVSVGASGAIFGVAGALMTTVWRHRATLPALFGGQAKSGLLFYVVYSLAQGFSHQGTDNAAHVGGLAAGCLMACLLPIRLGQARTPARGWRPAGAALAACALVAVLAFAAPSSGLDHRAVLNSESQLLPAVKAFQDTLAELQADTAKGGDSDIATAWALDKRGRDHFAPRFQAISGQFAALTLRPRDPRQPMVEHFRAISDTLQEMLSMASVPNPVTRKPEPGDGRRFQVLETQLKRQFEDLDRASQAMKAGQR